MIDVLCIYIYIHIYIYITATCDAVMFLGGYHSSTSVAEGMIKLINFGGIITLTGPCRS